MTQPELRPRSQNLGYPETRRAKIIRKLRDAALRVLGDPVTPEELRAFERAMQRGVNIPVGANAEAEKESQHQRTVALWRPFWQLLDAYVTAETEEDEDDQQAYDALRTYVREKLGGW